MERLLLVVLSLTIPTTHVTAFHHARVRCDELSTQTPSNIIYTVFDLISEHTLISGHPPHFVLVEIIARACRDICVFDAN